jgi:hypothetical protein
MPFFKSLIHKESNQKEETKDQTKSLEEPPQFTQHFFEHKDDFSQALGLLEHLDLCQGQLDDHDCHDELEVYLVFWGEQ